MRDTLVRRFVELNAQHIHEAFYEDLSDNQHWIRNHPGIPFLHVTRSLSAGLFKLPRDSAQLQQVQGSRSKSAMVAFVEMSEQRFHDYADQGTWMHNDGILTYSNGKEIDEIDSATAFEVFQEALVTMKRMIRESVGWSGVRRGEYTTASLHR